MQSHWKPEIPNDFVMLLAHVFDNLIAKARTGHFSGILQ